MHISIRTMSSIAAALGFIAIVASCDAPSRSSLTAPEAFSLSNEQSQAKPAIVLVHGAWADGSGWSGVMKVLQRDGYTVSAVQNSLRSLEGDIESTRRVIDAQAGPVVVVGHSYGGAVITGAAAGRRNVKALVYIAAFAPEPGEVFGLLIDKFGPSALDASLRPDAAGYLYIDRAQFPTVFASDLPPKLAEDLAASQTPVNSAVFSSALTEAAWKTIPSWYLVAKNDRTIKPELERFMAARMGARTFEIESAHLPFMSQPQAVARLIEQAARSIER
jgi:pimeloyl-ACP methyl ester carboxylesterase